MRSSAIFILIIGLLLVQCGPGNADENVCVDPVTNQRVKAGAVIKNKTVQRCCRRAP